MAGRRARRNGARYSGNGPKAGRQYQRRVWLLAEQLAGITEHLTLDPGDMASIGIPAGVGLHAQRFMKVGGRSDAEIGLLGRLSVEKTESV